MDADNAWPVQQRLVPCIRLQPPNSQPLSPLPNAAFDTPHRRPSRLRKTVQFSAVSECARVPCLNDGLGLGDLRTDSTPFILHGLYTKPYHIVIAEPFTGI